MVFIERFLSFLACILFVQITTAHKIRFNNGEETDRYKRSNEKVSFRNISLQVWIYYKGPFKIESFTGNLDSSFHDASQVKITERNIPVLYTGAVNDLRRLVYLNLSYNAIKEIHPGAFRGLPELMVLTLKGNEISEIGEGVVNLTSIWELYLTSNLITTIHPNAFKGMKYLKGLDLSSNQIKTIHSNTFKGLEELTILNLHDNKIAEWNPDLFEDNPKMCDILFSRNEIESLPAHAFKNMKGCIRFAYRTANLVDFSNNKIRTIHPTSFLELGNLYYLDLQGNLISELQPGTFSSLTDIRSISLLWNQIQCLSQEFLTTVPNDFSVRAGALDIDKNPWNCTCLEEVSKWNEKHRPIISVDLVNRTCTDEKLRQMGVYI